LAMAAPAPASLLALLREHRLLSPAQVDELMGCLQIGSLDAPSLPEELLRRGWLTPFQVEELLEGRGGSLTLGPYLLLDRLGGGGMGRVFKARHRLMERVVAVKLIHPDRVHDPHWVERFRREVRALGRVAHPNVVMAHDADQVGATYFLVME